MVAGKFCRDNNYDIEEATAEAYFWLTMFFTEKVALYEVHKDYYQKYLCVFIKFKLRDYFTRRKVETDKQYTPDEFNQLITYLSGLVGDEEAFSVAQYLRNGIEPRDLSIIDLPLSRKTRKLRRNLGIFIRNLHKIDKDPLLR
jgi:hypothetical protein